MHGGLPRDAWPGRDGSQLRRAGVQGTRRRARRLPPTRARRVRSRPAYAALQPQNGRCVQAGQYTTLGPAAGSIYCKECKAQLFITYFHRIHTDCVSIMCFQYELEAF